MNGVRLLKLVVVGAAGGYFGSVGRIVGMVPTLPRPEVPMRRALALVLILACGPVVQNADNDAGHVTTSAASTTDMTSTTLVMSTSGSAEPTSTSTASEETGAAATTEDDTGLFIKPTDIPLTESCDPWSQDCPAGEKCTWYNDDGGGFWNNTKCVPVMENPAQEGSPCFVVDDGVSGIDNCDLGLMCWDVDAENQGFCVALCHGTDEAPLCDAPKTICSTHSFGFGVCLPGCEPLLEDCDPSDVCVGNPGGGSYICVLDASGDEGQQHDPCMSANTCDPGLACVEVTAAVECDQDEMGCCQPFCDLTDPDADAKCEGVGQVCTPHLVEGMVVPGYEYVGYCAVPM